MDLADSARLGGGLFGWRGHRFIGLGERFVNAFAHQRKQNMGDGGFTSVTVDCAARAMC